MNANLNTNNILLDDNAVFYKKLLNEIPDLIFQLTLSADNKLYFPFLNKKIISFFEVNDFELKSNPEKVLLSRIYYQDIKILLETLNQSKENLKKWSCEFRVNFGKKKEFWLKVDANIEKIDEDGKVVFYGRLTDINDIKQREIEIIHSEARYQFALEASKKGIWDYDIKTGKVYFSKQSLKILKYSKKDNINTNEIWDSKIHPDDINDYLEAIELHKNNKTAYFESTKRVLNKDGIYKWILSNGKIIERDTNGNPVRITGTHTDVTSNKEKEQELLTNLEIINKQNGKLLNFAHIVSHNLRSHTSNFNMLLNILDEEKNQESKAECLNHLKTASNTLTKTIEHLQELVDIQSNVVHKKESININKYLNRIFELLNKDLKENNVTIVNKINSKASLNSNPAYLESILLNFTTNAIKYSSKDRKPTIEYSFSKQKDKHVLTIKDNGLGINMKLYKEKLFGMYKTFHDNPNSRGIGLFITKNQIEAMGGTIEVKSKVNYGTTFKIIFSNEI